MIECPFCHTKHVENTLFCEECGTFLLDEDNLVTDPLEIEAAGSIGSIVDELETSSSEQEEAPLALRLSIEHGLREVEVSLDKTIHLGRLDPLSDTFPEIDLSDVGGAQKGVSRRHARILKRGNVLIVEDLGSINGTFVNGQKLAPYMAEVLSDGDYLHLGKVVIQIKFQSS